MNEKTLKWAEAQSYYYKTLTSPRRILILLVLAKQEMSVGDISTAIGVSMQNTSQHLRLMKNRGLLGSRRDGQTIYYHVTDDKLLDYMGISDCQDRSQDPEFTWKT